MDRLGSRALVEDARLFTPVRILCRNYSVSEVRYYASIPDLTYMASTCCSKMAKLFA
jgi:hypothetical protein